MDQADWNIKYGLASALRVEPIFDQKLIKAFFNLPEIKPTFFEDGLEELKIDFNREIYLAAFSGLNLIGIYIIEMAGSICIKMHIAIMKEYRSKFLKDSALLALKYVIENSKIQKVCARVPAPYRHLYLFCKKLGFRDEGLNRSSFVKFGKAQDVHQLGITRQEILGAINEQSG